MKNIHIIPTDKPSRLVMYSKKLNRFRLLDESCDDWKGRLNIYITNSEEIKEGYVLHLPTNRILEVGVITESNGSKSFREKEYHINGIEVLICDCKKIILTTDQDLIKDGIQTIPDDFLEWFVKNSSCERVEVQNKKLFDGFLDPEYGSSKWRFEYKIIIPKEEPKQALVEIMQDDEELGLYDEPRVEELIPYIGSFLLRNGFKGSGGNTYHNPKCTITVLEDCYQINFNYPEGGEVSIYTDSHSIPHLVGVLTWDDLIDKNYKK